MNNAGCVVGTYAGSAASWSDTGITDISAVAPSSFGCAINNRGDIGGDFNGAAFAHATGILRNIGQLGIFDSS